MSIRELPEILRARVRAALRQRFGDDADIEPWLSRWMCSCESKTQYVRCELERVLPRSAHWLIGFVDVEAVAREWSDCCRVVYAIDPLDTVHVFADNCAHVLDPGAKR